MNIGIPKEILSEEKRISLTAQGVYSLVKEGHNVYIEKGAGVESSFSDVDFQKMGGEIVFSPDEVYMRSDLVVKVNPPTEAETELLRPDQMIFSFLQLALQSKNALQNLIDKKVTAIGTELIEIAPKYRPVLVAMSEIAGNMMPQIAGRFLQHDAGGRGIAIGRFPGIAPSTIVILGAGNLGFNSAKSFVSLGAQVIVLDEDVARLRHVENELGSSVITAIANHYSLEKALRSADVFLGAVYQTSKKAPILITRDHLKLMKKGSLIIDAAIDQGGCVETSRPTTHSDPIFIEDDIIHYCVPNITSVVARTSSRALNNIVLPFILEITRNGLKTICENNNILLSGMYIRKGKCINSGIADLFDLEYHEFKC
ncbi:alanine dehydrogenase [candidate division KSB1 bacterium]|nr:alanine dehydrogenase [candidate division KSB1 bacterium]MBL7093252.1 alanine dehydrogenase [candidate division KSB1 bacterium]